MSIFHDNMTTLQIYDAVAPLLLPLEEELIRCQELQPRMNTLNRQAAFNLEPELFLLKIGVGLQYTLGFLERLGMPQQGLLQFYEIYVQRLQEGFAGVFKNAGQQSTTLLRNRVVAYEKAYHQPHAEDRHLNVSDTFTRFVGVPDDPELVNLCLESCKKLNSIFIKEYDLLRLEALENQKKDKEEK